MKQKKYTLLLLLLMEVMLATAQKELVIYHTNDTHSCIMPLSEQLADTAVAGRGGYLRRIALLKEARKTTPDLLLFDSGDFSQGSPYYTLFKGDVEVGLMNKMGYNAGTIGNHEFDYGLENLARVLKNLNFPIVCSNYKFNEYGLDKIVKPYYIFRHNGLKIGVFGLSPKLDGLVEKKNYRETEYLDPIATAQQMADLLHRKKCDLVICLSHLGWLKEGDLALVSQTRGIDLVLGGHSHTFFTELRYVKNLDGKEIPVNQNGKSGLYVGRVKLNFSPVTSLR